MRIMMALAGSALIAAAVYLEVAPDVYAADVGVSVRDNFYEDSSGDSITTVNVGDQVIWTWVSNSSPHTVTADDSSFNSGNLQQTSGTFSQTFNAAGTFAYFCQLHGGAGGFGMSGTIIVQQGAPTPTNTTTAPTATRTSGPSSTPVTATATAAASATPGTPAATATVAAATPVTAAPSSATQAVGGAGAGVRAPVTGEGAGATATRQYDLWGITLGAVGLVVLAGAALVRRRKP